MHTTHHELHNEGGQNTYGIYIEQNETLGPNIQVGPNNTVHDMKWGVFYGYGTGASNLQVYKNTIYHCDHGVVLGDSNPSTGNQTTGSVTATCGGANGNMICQTLFMMKATGTIMETKTIMTEFTLGPTANLLYYVIVEGDYIHGIR